MMALNDTFNILPKTTQLLSDLTSHFRIKDYWEEKFQDNPSKKEFIFYCE